MAFIRVGGISGQKMSQYALIMITGLQFSPLHIAVWQSPSERWGSCQTSREGLWIIAALGLSEVERQVRGGGTPVTCPLR
jgi:hypothetical protein